MIINGFEQDRLTGQDEISLS